MAVAALTIPSAGSPDASPPEAAHATIPSTTDLLALSPSLIPPRPSHTIARRKSGRPQLPVSIAEPTIVPVRSPPEDAIQPKQSWLTLLLPEQVAAVMQKVSPNRSTDALVLSASGMPCMLMVVVWDQ